MRRHPPTPTTSALRLVWIMGLAAAVTLAALGSLTTLAPPAAAETTDPEWLVIANGYRRSAALAPVTENAAATEGARRHSSYMVQNRTMSHGEDPKRAGASADGVRAGSFGDVAAGNGTVPSERALIERWMASPFHALTILDPDASAFGFGQAGDSSFWAATLSTGWDRYLPAGTSKAVLTEAAALVTAAHPELARRSWRASGTAARIIVKIGGRRFLVRRGTVTELAAGESGAGSPVVWPGDGATVPLTAYAGNEKPDPLTSCPSSTGGAGLLIVVRRGVATEVASVVVRGPDGSELDVCTLSAARYTNPDASQRTLGQRVLSDHGAVVIIPRLALAAGSHRVELTLHDGARLAWGFTVTSGELPRAAEPLQGTAPTRK